jgi:NADH oxidase (H2O2-forming)
MNPIIIIGSSAAAISACNTLLRLDPSSSIICITQEAELPYNKCFLADYLAGTKEESALFLLRPEIRAKIDMRFSCKVLAIDAENKILHTESPHANDTVAYHKLLIATGSSPYIPSAWQKNRYANVYTFHTLADTQAILSAVQSYDRTPRVVIIGAGLSGIECADALRNYPAHITVIDQSSHILSNLLTSEMASYIQHAAEKQGVSFYLGARVENIVGSDNQANYVTMQDGQSIFADMVIIATGLRANKELAEQAGIRIEGDGIWVDDHLQTSKPDVYAAGDVITITDTVSSKRVRSTLWPDAMQQGMIVAHAMLGKSMAYAGACIMTGSVFFGYKCGVAGYDPKTFNSSEWIVDKGSSHYYAYRIVDGVLKGFMLLGEQIPLGTCRQALKAGAPFSI